MRILAALPVLLVVLPCLARASEPAFTALPACPCDKLDDPSLRPFLRISGTVFAGQDDVARDNEYFVALTATEKPRLDEPSKWTYFVNEMTRHTLAPMARGRTQDFTARLRLAGYGAEGPKGYLAVGLMEKDYLGAAGSVDTAVCVMLGGFPDKVASTQWLHLRTLCQELPTTVWLGPNWTGTLVRLTLETIEFEPAPAEEQR